MGLYGTDYQDLTDQQKEMWDLAFKVLQDGQRLYGTDQEDVEHLGWMLGIIVGQMKKQAEPTACYIEVVHDEGGFGVSFILLEAEPVPAPSSQDSSVVPAP